jgi:hypothetical protein
MKKHKVTACKKEDVMRMAGNGHTHEAIASLLKISVSTLERRYTNELMDGATLKHEAIMSRLQQQGASGSKSAPAAAQRMFLARARGFGNNLPSRLNVTHEYAGPPRRVTVRLPRNGREGPDVERLSAGTIEFYDPTPEELNPALLIEHKPADRKADE